MEYQAKVTVDSNAYNILFGYTLTSYGGRYVNMEIDNSELVSDGNGGYYFTVDIPIDKCTSVPVPGNTGTYETYGINVDCLCKITDYQSGKNPGLKCIWYALPLCHHDMSYYTWDERATFEGNVKQDVQAFGKTNINNQVKNNVIIKPGDSAVCNKTIYSYNLVVKTKTNGIILYDSSPTPFGGDNSFVVTKLVLKSVVYESGLGVPDITFTCIGHYAFAQWTYTDSSVLSSSTEYYGWMRLSNNNIINLDGLEDGTGTGDSPSATYKIKEIFHLIEPLGQAYPDKLDSEEPLSYYFIHNKAQVYNDSDLHKLSIYVNDEISNTTATGVEYIVSNKKSPLASDYICSSSLSCSFNPHQTDYDSLLETISNLPEHPLVYGVDKSGSPCVKEIATDSSDIIGPIDGIIMETHYTIGQSGTVEPKENDSERW